jgi:hypothetical protein
MLRKLSLLLALTGGCFLALSAPTQAQKEKKFEMPKEEIQRERIQKLASAFEMAEQGRRLKAPEYLITAAGMLRQLSAIKDLDVMKTHEVKPEIKGEGDANSNKEVKASSLLEQADELFKDASDLGALQGVNVDKLIRQARNRDLIEERAVVGGPKQISRLIGPGQYHVYHFHFFDHASTNWVFKSTALLHVSVVRADIDNAYFLDNTKFATRHWTPGFQPNSKVHQVPFVIRVQSYQKHPVQYQMFLQ